MSSPSRPGLRLRVLPAIAFAWLAVAGGDTANAQTGPGFDHNLTGFPLSGAHTRASCETCHALGRFAGTPRLCDACHDGTGRIATTARSSDHIPVAGDCGDCHTTYRWVSARMDHSVVTTRCDGCHYGGMAEGTPATHIRTTVQCDQCHRTTTWRTHAIDHSSFSDPCSSCHDGISASGKHAQHILTNDECDLCHSTRRWVPASFDHSMITGACSTCHNGMDATGKNAQHLTTTAECDVCHTTDRWVPASFDHSMITGACSTCHNGMDATGKNTLHLTTTAECDLCHTTDRWIPAGFDHTLVMGSCSSCHNGMEATGTPAVHFDSSLECDACHTTTRWTSPDYAHMGFYPGDHRRTLDCTDCHGANNEMVTWSSPSYQPDCAACHERDFKRDSHKKVDGIDLKYTVGELRDCSGSCHEFEDAGMTRIKKTRNSEHRVGDSEF